MSLHDTTQFQQTLKLNKQGNIHQVPSDNPYRRAQAERDYEKRSSSRGTPNRGSGQQILKFPENLGTDPTQGNYMQFTFKEIAAAGGNRSGSRGADPRNLVFKAAYGWPIICLPIPSGLNEAYQQNWDVAQVAGRHAMLAEHGATTINAMGQFIADRGRRKGAINEFVGDIQGSAGAAGTAREGETLLQRAGRIIGNTTAELGGMALTSNLVELGDIARAGQYAAGLRMIDQAMLSYGGPGFRSFQYNFSFKPNSEKESRNVHIMCQRFKEFSAPNQRSTKYTRVYDLPGVFKIQFFWGAAEHRTIGRIGHCALTNIAIRYGGEKFTTFDQSHDPIQWDITLDFKELELLNRDAIKAENTNTDSSNWPNYEPHHSSVSADTGDVIPTSGAY